MILKEVKVICFDTVLEVLILKLDRGDGLPQRHGDTERGTEIFRKEMAPPSRVFAYEWQAKELRDREFVRVARKGLTGARFCAFGARRTWFVTGRARASGMQETHFVEECGRY